jgi:hypothetical protein
MATNLSALKQYSDETSWRTIPAELQALGEINGEDGQNLFSIAFTTHRDIITEIGYSASSACPAPLCGCAACICELAKGKAIMAAQLLGPDDIAKKLSDDGSLEDQMYYFAILAILALKNAISSYAEYKKTDLEIWKSQNSKNSPASS